MALCENLTSKSDQELTGQEIKMIFSSKYPYLRSSDDFYFMVNGKLLYDDSVFADRELIVRMVPKLCGGKGGFGSMLRAIGAQIEKTTNREACRDLSGRRLRDINEEQRLKNWIAQQADREREAEERKKKKLEKLLREPKHEFKDEKYTEERLKLAETITDSVEQGFKAAPQELKRKSEYGEKGKKKKKKVKGMLDDLGDISSDDSDNEPRPSTSLEVAK
ncbi:unnamed protein product [Bemisia tabaci]|uniref:SDE2-like domain-containing protein n=1 Tax=Bemisia tabaci TaxID=7038 RepID=A0A9P0A2A7_BEMTA|nr:unnamed protein product [Bemisia tabaci]